MRASTALLLVVLVAVGLFAGLNWTAVTAPTDLSLLFARVTAPLGMVLLTVIAAITILYAMLLAWRETAALLEARRHARELDAQRRLAQEAEASRFTELRGYLAAELGELRTAPDATTREVLARLDRLETDLRGDVERAGNTLAAYIGELEERLDRGDRVSAPGPRPSIEPH
jgi:uncharacterized integral membrane protein